MGVNEQIIFPEIDYDKIDTLRGLDITITTTAQNDDEGRALLTAMRFPFRGIGPDAEENASTNKELVEEVAEEAPVAETEETVAEETAAETEKTEEAPAEEAADNSSEEDKEEP